jgi:hypothetical protein
MAARSFALVVGALLLVEGIWGFFSEVVFGVLDTNPLHALMGIGLGLAGLRVASGSGSARRYCHWLAGIMLTTGGLRLLPDFASLMFVTLELNYVEAVFSVGLGVVALMVAHWSRPKPLVLRFHSFDMPGYQPRTSPAFSITSSARPGHASPL